MLTRPWTSVCLDRLARTLQLVGQRVVHSSVDQLDVIHTTNKRISKQIYYRVCIVYLLAICNLRKLVNIYIYIV